MRSRMLSMDRPQKGHRGAGILTDVFQKGLQYKKVQGADLLFPGEAHTILKTGALGKKRMANYMGPGTQVKQRVQRGDEPVSDMDRISQAHDVRYSLAKRPQDVREADVRFLKKARTSTDYNFNKAQGIGGVAAKYALEGKRGVQYPTQMELDENDENDNTRERN